MILKKAINQRKSDKNIINSIHEQQAQCIPKGKTHTQYEFGSKVSYIVSKNKGIILGALNFKNNPYDGDTIDPALDQVKRIHNGYTPENLGEDRGYRGCPKIR
jgi:IS5 family transposase